MLSYSIWPNRGNSQISITVLSSLKQYPQSGEERVPALWLRREFFQRWVYARQLRADPRLLAVIKFFAGRIRRSDFQFKPAGEQVEKTVREVVTVPSETGLGSLQRSLVGQQVLSNPVVQEVMRVFSANLTDIELVQKEPPSPVASSSRSLAEIPFPLKNAAWQQPRTFGSHQSETNLEQTAVIDELETRVHELEKQLRRRELEKEALRRQVKKLGGDKPWA